MINMDIRTKKWLYIPVIAASFRYFTLLLAVAITGSWTIQEPVTELLYMEICVLLVSLTVILGEWIKW